jgi:hypothetical protein
VLQIFDSVSPKFNYFSLTDGLSCYDIHGITAVKEVVCQLVFKAKIFFIVLLIILFLVNDLISNYQKIIKMFGLIEVSNSQLATF